MNMKQLQNTYLNLLKEFISFKTISTDISFQKEMTKAVSWLTELFQSNGFKVTNIAGKNHNPVIIAKYIADTKLKTILVYGHYDIQPAESNDGWKSDPFTLTKKVDRFIARGVVDNKGQILAHMVAVFDAIKKSSLSSNITFIIEGNEESGNPALPKIIEKNKKLLDCDIVMISDGEMLGKNPTLDVSFRGGGNMRIVYETSSNDRHSGLFGGSIPNSALELSKTLSKLKENNKIAFESFYRDTVEISKEQRKINKYLSSLLSIKNLADVLELTTETNMDPHSQIGLRPTIEISGFTSGYTGVGFKNIVPGKAEARLNIRTVYPQVSREIMQSVKEFIKDNTPSYVKYSIEMEVHGDPIFLDYDHIEIKPIKKLLTDIHNKEILHQHVGGSIPVVADFKSILNKPIILIPLCNNDCNMHGVDENFSQYHMKKALEFTSALWKRK